MYSSLRLDKRVDRSYDAEFQIWMYRDVFTIDEEEVSEKVYNKVKDLLQSYQDISEDIHNLNSKWGYKSHWWDEE